MASFQRRFNVGTASFAYWEIPFWDARFNNLFALKKVTKHLVF